MKNKDIKIFLLRFLIAMSLIGGFASSVSAAEYSLFVNDLNSTLQAVGDVTPLLSNLPHAKQYRPVSINPLISNQNIILEKDVLDLNLFPGTRYRAQIDKVSNDINGTRTLRGHFIDHPFGYFTISMDSNQCIGLINIPDKDEYYLIQYETKTRRHYLLDMNYKQLDILEDAPPLVSSQSVSLQSIGTNMLAATLESNPTDQVTLDVMIVYTPAANQWANSFAGGIQNVISQAISLGQISLDNSDTYLNLNLVYSGQINYTESGDSSLDLERLTFTSDEYMNDVQALRDQYHADIVALFSKTDDTGGIGWLLENSSGNERFAYSVVRIQQAAISYTYIHEMGHNMGCGHHKQQLVQAGPGLYSYSAGWRWTGIDNGKYCSVMSYSWGEYFPDGIEHVQVPYFSNPNILYKGIATGDSINGDNARTIREVKSVLANYRTGSTGSSTFIDIGLRLYDGSTIVKIACEQGAPTSPLRISKFGTTYGIALVDIGDPYATGIIIQTSSGPKAIRKLK